jgi:type II secretory pathway pseudopilin PulG
MDLRRQEQGYAMAVLLVGISIMAVLMTAVMPVWKHEAQREKEAELVFRGEQYGRALMLFSRKHGPGTTPPTIDVLLQEHFLRKKYKDPITGDDFQVVNMGQNTPGSTQPPGAQRGGAPTSSSPLTSPLSAVTPQRGGGPGGVTPGVGGATSGGVGGVYAVVSKSKDQSIRIYKGRTHYNEWVFTAPAQPQAAGATAPGGMPGVGGRPGGPGGSPIGPGGGIGGGRRLGGPGQPNQGGPFPFPTPTPRPGSPPRGPGR